MARTLIRIDRNGTKYYADDTCKRCGGAGERSEWYYTGMTCYECGGTGRSNPRIEKVYTPEYQAVLDERRAEREAKKLGYASAQEMRKAREAEAARREAQRIAEEEAEAARVKAEQERVAALKARSNYVGTVGEKLTATVTWEGSTYFERRSYSGYGTETCYIHSFRDTSGNKLVWKTTKGLSLEEGQTVSLTGTVKDHSEYHNEKQTVLTRCRVQ